MQAHEPDRIHGVAAISSEAQELVARAIEMPARDMSLPIAEIRNRTRADCTPASKAALERTGVTLSEREIECVRCMVIDPPALKSNREIVYLFGGGFCQGSPFEDLPISAHLAAKTGARVIAPSYPLAPEHPYPAALDALTPLVSAILEDTPSACLCGESAGGTLALASVLRLKAGGLPHPRALALMSPAVDLLNSGDSGAADRDPFLREADTGTYMSNYIPRGTDPTDPGLSPIYGTFDEDFPPVMVTTGTRDNLLSGCVRLDRVLRDAGAGCTLRVWEGMWHVFEFYADIPEAQASLSDIAEFLTMHLR
ncbi:MAG: alpha/beta hydrolase [Pseudomonadota bacterium]